MASISGVIPSFVMLPSIQELYTQGYASSGGLMNSLIHRPPPSAVVSCVWNYPSSLELVTMNWFVGMSPIVRTPRGIVFVLNISPDFPASNGPLSAPCCSTGGGAAVMVSCGGRFISPPDELMAASLPRLMAA